MLDCIFVNLGVPALEGKFRLSEQGLGDSSLPPGRASAVSSISASRARFGYFRRLHVALWTIEFVTLASAPMMTGALRDMQARQSGSVACRQSR